MCYYGRYTHGEHKDYSFKAKCHTPLKWFFEDKEYYNPYYPVSAWLCSVGGLVDI